MSLLLALTGAGSTTVIVSANTTGTYANTGLSSVPDTKLREQNPTNNYATDTSWSASSWASGDTETSLINFSGLSTIGAGTVTNAEIGFRVDNNIGNESIEIREMLRNWVDVDADWTEFSTGNSWQTGGGLGALDIGATSIASGTNPNLGNWFTLTGTNLNTLVQSWVSGATNNGVLVKRVNMTAFNTTFAAFVSSEGTNGLRPYLKFDWVASGGINVALTGISQTELQGSFGLSFSRVLSGLSETISQSTLAATISKLLLGESETQSQGTLTPNIVSSINVALTGQEYNYNAGSLTSSINKALSGQSETESLGNITATFNKELTAQNNTISAGTLSASLTKALSGEFETISQGTLTPNIVSSINVALTGQSYTYSQGNLSASNAILLIGQWHSIGQGLLSATASKAIAGSGELITQGAVIPQFDIQIQLTGQQYSYLQGDLVSSALSSLFGDTQSCLQGILSDVFLAKQKTIKSDDFNDRLAQISNNLRDNSLISNNRISQTNNTRIKQLSGKR